MMLDADAKMKRRNEWDKKIGEVKEEVKVMRDEEILMLENISSRRRRRAPTTPLIRRRHYSTMPAYASPTPPKIRQDELLREDIGKDTLETHELPLSDPALDVAGQPDLDGDSSTPGYETSNWVSNDPLRTRAIQRLATKQLAIRFMLRPTLAHNYSGTRMNYAPDFELPKLNTEELLDELNSIRRRINTLKYSESQEILDPLLEDSLWSDSVKLREERQQLDDQLFSLLRLRSREFSSPELLLRICDNLLSTQEPISPTAMSLLIQHFVWSRENDIVTIILRTLLPSRILLSTSVIMSTLNFYNRARDLHGFESFLRRLQGVGGAVNIPKRWTTSRVGNVEVAVPPAPGHPYVFTELICASIKFEQFEKADAWTQIMRQTGYGEDHAVLGTYLRCYAEKSDWEKGAPFLLKAVTFIMSTRSHKDGAIERLIVYMLLLCRACQKPQLLSDIIFAAIESGFQWEPAYNKSDRIPLIQEVLISWRNAAKESTTSTTSDRTTAEKCYSFGTKIGEPIRKAISNNETERGTYFKKLNQELHSNLNYVNYLSESKANVTSRPETSDFGATGERDKSAILDALEDSQASSAAHARGVEPEQFRAEISSLRRELDVLRKLVKQNNNLDASLEDRSNLGLQREQQAAPVDRLPESNHTNSPETTPAQTGDLQAASRGIPLQEDKPSKIHYSQLPESSSSSSPSSSLSNEAKSHIPREEHPSSIAAKSQETLYAPEVRRVTPAIWKAQERTPAISKFQRVTPKIRRVIRQNEVESSAVPPPVLKVEGEQKTTTIRSGHRGVLEILTIEGYRELIRPFSSSSDE